MAQSQQVASGCASSLGHWEQPSVKSSALSGKCGKVTSPSGRKISRRLEKGQGDGDGESYVLAADIARRLESATTAFRSGATESHDRSPISMGDIPVTSRHGFPVPPHHVTSGHSSSHVFPSRSTSRSEVTNSILSSSTHLLVSDRQSDSASNTPPNYQYADPSCESPTARVSYCDCITCIATLNGSSAPRGFGDSSSSIIPTSAYYNQSSNRFNHISEDIDVTTHLDIKNKLSLMDSWAVVPKPVSTVLQQTSINGTANSELSIPISPVYTRMDTPESPPISTSHHLSPPTTSACPTWCYSSQSSPQSASSPRLPSPAELSAISHEHFQSGVAGLGSPSFGGWDGHYPGAQSQETTGAAPVYDPSWLRAEEPWRPVQRSRYAAPASQSARGESPGTRQLRPQSPYCVTTASRHSPSATPSMLSPVPQPVPAPVPSPLTRSPVSLTNVSTTPPQSLPIMAQPILSPSRTPPLPYPPLSGLSPVPQPVPPPQTPVVPLAQTGRLQRVPWALSFVPSAQSPQSLTPTFTTPNPAALQQLPGASGSLSSLSLTSFPSFAALPSPVQPQHPALLPAPSMTWSIPSLPQAYPVPIPGYLTESRFHPPVFRAALTWPHTSFESVPPDHSPQVPGSLPRPWPSQSLSPVAVASPSQAPPFNPPVPQPLMPTRTLSEMSTTALPPSLSAQLPPLPQTPSAELPPPRSPSPSSISTASPSPSWSSWSSSSLYSWKSSLSPSLSPSLSLSLSPSPTPTATPSPSPSPSLSPSPPPPPPPEERTPSVTPPPRIETPPIVRNVTAVSWTTDPASAWQINPGEDMTSTLPRTSRLCLRRSSKQRAFVCGQSVRHGKCYEGAPAQPPSYKHSRRVMHGQGLPAACAVDTANSHLQPDLPQPSGDVRRDWDLLLNAVRARRQHWTQYLAYTIARNRELMRISGLPGARTLHVFPSPHMTGNQEMTSSHGSAGHYYLPPQQGRRALVVQEHPAARETVDPSPEE